MSTRESSPLIEAVNMSAGYGAAPAVRDINLNVCPGEVVALLGANGAGKTTTLLSLVGALRPKSGAVLWNGSQRRKPLHRRAREGLSYVPDDGGVFRGLTTRQNLSLARHADRQTATDVFPELHQVLDRKAGVLSGGEQRMLAVGRALNPQAKLLVADELSLGLAPLTVGVILSAIRRAADTGLAALIVEQHVHRVLEIADRVYVMQRGSIKLQMSAADARQNLAEIQRQYLSAADAGDPA